MRFTYRRRMNPIFMICRLKRSRSFGVLVAADGAVLSDLFGLLGRVVLAGRLVVLLVLVLVDVAVDASGLSPLAMHAPGVPRRRSLPSIPCRHRASAVRSAPAGAGPPAGRLCWPPGSPGGVAEWLRQGPAKPCTPVRFRSPPPNCVRAGGPSTPAPLRQLSPGRDRTAQASPRT